MKNPLNYISKGFVHNRDAGTSKCAVFLRSTLCDALPSTSVSHDNITKAVKLIKEVENFPSLLPPGLQSSSVNYFFDMSKP